MRLALSPLLLLAAGFLLMGCEDMRKNTPAPDLTTKIVPSADGKRMVALPPECENWSKDDEMALENQPSPHFGCANARNLAAMVERPEDLIAGRAMGPSNGGVAGANYALYKQGKTIPLVNPNSKTDTPATGQRKEVTD
jgi:hypothetical protein